MLEVEDLERRFITEHSVVSKVEAERTETNVQVDVAQNEFAEEDQYDEGEYVESEEVQRELTEQYEDPAQDFEPISIPLFDKNVWDDSALIRAWNESILQKDATQETTGPKEATPKCKLTVSRVDVEKDAEGRAPTYNRAELPNIGAKKLCTRATKKNRNKPALAQEQSGNAHQHKQNLSEPTNSAQPGLEYSTYPQNQTTLPFVPPTSTVPASQDEDFNNLISAWYFAGYYTAVYQKKK